MSLKPKKKRKSKKYKTYGVEVFNMDGKMPAGKEIINASKLLINCGFILDGRRYVINGNDIASEFWIHDFDSVLDRAQTIPRIYIIISNILSEVNEFIEKYRISYDKWIDKQWRLQNDVDSGLYSANAKRMEAHVKGHRVAMQYRAKSSELRAVADKLKGMIKVLDMQYQMLTAVIYHNRRSESIFQSGAGSMIQKLTS